MKKNLGKIMAAGLVFTMTLGLTAAAFAEDENPTVEYVEAYEAPSVEPYEAPAAEEPVAVIEAPVTEAAAPADKEPVVEAPAVEEGSIEEPAAEETPTEEACEEPANSEEPLAEEAAEDAADEEAAAPFDVVAAYRYYLSLETDREREEYLDSLSPENREALLRYIRLMEEQTEPAEETEAIEIEEIFDEEVPLAAAPVDEEELEDDTEAEEILDEEVPLAAAPVDEEEPEDDTEAEEILDEEVPLALPESPKSVSIFSDRRAVMTEGETVTISSVIEGFENCEAILYVWLVDKGNGFEEVPGANSDSYSFTATAETLSWDWQLEVLYC